MPDQHSWLAHINGELVRMNNTLEYFKQILDQQLADQERKKQEHYVTQDPTLAILRCSCGIFFGSFGEEDIKPLRRQAVQHLIEVGVLKVV